MSARAQEEQERSAVLIVEDHPVVRAVVRMACEASEGLTVVGEADGADAAEACRRLRPDVVVMDPAEPGPPGLELARRLRSGDAPPRILVLIDPADEASALSWMRMEIDGLLAKSSGVRAISRAIETIAVGGRVFAPGPRRQAVRELGRLLRSARSAAPGPASLTVRELDVLRLLAVGMTIRQVASRTGTSPRTVESHVTSLYRKLGVRTRIQAVARAAALGYVDVRPLDRP